MFNVFQVVSFLTILTYSILFDFRLIAIYSFFMAIYHIMPMVVGAKIRSVRETVRISTWDVPRDSSIHMKLDLNLNKVDSFLDNKNKSRKQGEPKITLTHVVCRALGEAYNSVPKSFGKIIFGA